MDSTYLFGLEKPRFSLRSFLSSPMKKPAPSINFSSQTSIMFPSISHAQFSFETPVPKLGRRPIRNGFVPSDAGSFFFLQFQLNLYDVSLPYGPVFLGIDAEIATPHRI